MMYRIELQTYGDAKLNGFRSVAVVLRDMTRRNENGQAQSGCATSERYESKWREREREREEHKRRMTQ